MRVVLNLIRKFLEAPVRHALPLVAALLVMRLVYGLEYCLLVRVSAGPLTSAVATAWVLSMPVALLSALRKRISNRVVKIVLKIFGWVIAFVLVAYFAIVAIGEMGMIAAFKRFLVGDDIAIILQTDSEEASGFFSAYFRWWMVAPLVVAIAAVATSAIYARRLTRRMLPKAVGWLTAVFAIVTAVSFATGSFIRCGLNLIGDLSTQYYNIPSLSTTERRMDVVACADAHPRLVVLMIGESFDRKHASAYGYELPTTPCLLALGQDPGCVVFSDVTSPGTNTLKSFQRMLATSTSDDYDEWRHTSMLPTIMRSAGYRTTWITDTQQHGYFDNLPKRFAELCDTAVFTCPPLAMVYDSELLSPLNRAVADARADSMPHLIIINCRGQHLNYADRTPADRRRFTAVDYLSRPKHQRQILADYDNAVAYHDSVVGCMIDAIRTEEAVFIYLSDHGQDVFASDESYYGHANEGNAESERLGREIPFYIYLTPSAAERFPGAVDALREFVDATFTTRAFAYLLMDITGFTDADNPYDVTSISPFGGRLTEILKHR